MACKVHRARTAAASLSDQRRRRGYLPIPLVVAALAAVLLVVGQAADPAGAAPPASPVSEFQPNILWGGRSVAISVSPVNTQAAILATESGGLFKTTNGGSSWSRIDSLVPFRLWDVRYAPDDANIVIVSAVADSQSANGGGVWRSVDGGATWQQTTGSNPTCVATQPVTRPSAYGISIAPGGHVFVGTDCGISQSHDYGATWTNADPDPANAQRQILDVVAQAGGIVDICGADGHHRSINNGGNWTLFAGGAGALPGGFCSIDASPFENNVLFAAAGGNVFEGDPSGGGTAWTNLNGPNNQNRPPYVRTHPATDGDATHYDLFYGMGIVTFRQHCANSGGPGLRCPVQADPNCADAVDNDGDQMVNEGCPQVGSFSEGGATCKDAVDAPDEDPNTGGAQDDDAVVNDGCPVMEYFDVGAHADPMDIGFDTSVPGNRGCPILMVMDGGASKSTNCGVSWTASNSGLRALQLYEVTGTIVGGAHTDLYFGTQDNDIWASSDGGVTWPDPAQRVCCEGFFFQTPHTAPAEGYIFNATICGACFNTVRTNHLTSAPNGDGVWPNAPGNGGAPFLIEPFKWAQVSAVVPRLPNNVPESGAQCSNGTDDDFDGTIDDGCSFLFISEPEQGPECGNNTDDDADGAVNEGCPADGGAESGADCHDNVDDDNDGGDGAGPLGTNDGCSSIFSKETGAECGNATDDDGDGSISINDGCPRVGSFSESNCLDNADDPDEDPNTGGSQDDDATVNDGCPEIGVWARTGPALPRVAQAGFEVTVAGPPASPTIYVNTVKPGNILGLSKIVGISNGNATILPADSGLNNLGQYCNGQGTFRCPTVFGVDPNNPQHLIAADTGTNQMKVSTDGGASWTPDLELTALVTDNGRLLFGGTGVGSQAHFIGFDPTNGNRILVGTEAAGIIASLNGGFDWFKVENSERIPAISTFFFDEREPTIFVSSYGRGLWKLNFPATDLSITKSDFPDPVMAGQELFYTISVTNNGPNPATVEVLDNLPPQVQYIGSDLVPPLGCVEFAPGQLRCDVGVLQVGDTVTFTIKVRVRSNASVTSPSGSTTIINTAIAQSTDTVDPDPSDNTAQTATFAEELSDLRVTKVCKPDDPLPAGQTGTCTIYVDNLGPSDARSVEMDDAILSDGTFTIGTITPSQGTCNPPTPSNVVHCDLGNLVAASIVASGRATVTIDVTAAEQMDINDIATAVSATPDPDTSNNQAQESLGVSAVSDLRLFKTAAGSVVAGTNLTYNLTVTNDGPSTAANVTVQDTLPAPVTVQSVTGSGGATCNAGVPGDPFLPTTCNFDSLGLGASRTVTIIVTVNVDVLGTIQNDARAYSDTFDDDNSDNLASVATSVTAQADLSVTKTLTPNPVVAGTPLSYEITVTNSGPSTADDVTLTDPLAAALTLTSTSVSGGAGSCGLQTSTNTVDCQLGDLDPGESITVFIYTVVSPSTPPGSISNTATVAAATFDPDGSDNSASISTTVNTLADLAITLTSDKNVYKPSTTIHYQIIVVNSGPSDAQSVVVTQVLPGPKIGFYVSNDAGCPPPGGTTFTCPLGTIKAGESKTFQLNFFVRGNKRTIIQTATVGSGTADPDPSDNSSTRVVTVK